MAHAGESARASVLHPESSAPSLPVGPVDGSVRPAHRWSVAGPRRSAVDARSRGRLGPTRRRQNENAPKGATDCPRQRSHTCELAREAKARNPSGWRRRFRASPSPEAAGPRVNGRPASQLSPRPVFAAVRAELRCCRTSASRIAACSMRRSIRRRWRDNTTENHRSATKTITTSSIRSRLGG